MLAQIADLESRLHHTTMTASEEKRCVEEIGKLRKAKKAAAGADKKGEQAGNSEKRVEDLRADIKDCDNELNAIKEEQVGAGSFGNESGQSALHLMARQMASNSRQFSVPYPAAAAGMT